MAEVLQFHVPCGGMTAVEISPEAWERTRSFAEGAVFGCKVCNSSCPLWHIAKKFNGHEEFMAALLTQGGLRTSNS